MTGTFPRISIVTPNYNQAPYLERTLKSVLGQNYPALDYIVMDGGSNDASVEIIERHSGQLSYWKSAPDNGQYDAVTKGFAHATGEVMGWINSDDIYLPWTLRTVGEIFRDCPEVDWITSLTQPQIGQTEAWTGVHLLPGVSRDSFLDGRHLGYGWRNVGYIQQEATFWRRDLWEAAGGSVGQTSPTAGDFELWCTFFSHTEIACVTQPLAAFRSRPGQRSQAFSERYRAESEVALRRFRASAAHRAAPARQLGAMVTSVARRKPTGLIHHLGYKATKCISSVRGWRCEPALFL